MRAPHRAARISIQSKQAASAKGAGPDGSLRRLFRRDASQRRSNTLSDVRLATLALLLVTDLFLLSLTILIQKSAPSFDSFFYLLSTP
jgi:hypothetical protein